MWSGSSEQGRYTGTLNYMVVVVIGSDHYCKVKIFSGVIFSVLHEVDSSGDKILGKPAFKAQIRLCFIQKIGELNIILNEL